MEYISIHDIHTAINRKIFKIENLANGKKRVWDNNLKKQVGEFDSNQNFTQETSYSEGDYQMALQKYCGIDKGSNWGGKGW
jgi:hypothetical protein